MKFFRLLSTASITLAYSTAALAQTYPSPTLSAPKIAGSTSGQTVLQASPSASGTLTLPSATDTLVGRNTTDTLTNKTITSDQSIFTRPETGAVSLTDAVRWKNYAITPQDFDPNAGTGGDDSVALNKAVEAASKTPGPNAGRVYLPPPPSGFYNVCADSFRPQKYANGSASLVIEGPASGGATIRALPGCASGAVQFATMYIEGAAFGMQTKSAFKLTFENIRIDGSCISRYTVYNVYTVGLTFRNSVLRNAKAGNGANYYQDAGYETSMDNSNRLENINDPGVTPCYNVPADLPDYNLWTSTTDSQYGAVAVNARVANFYADSGGNNHFIGSHAWGYKGGVGSDNQPNLRPQYNYLIEGNNVLLGAIADSPVVSGFRIQNTIGDSTGAIMIGSTLIGPVDPGGSGISIGANVVNTTIANNNLQPIAGANAIVSDAAISPSNYIANNMGSTNGSPWHTYTPTFSCGAGTVGGTSGVSGRYRVVGKTVHFLASATITTNGTCATSVRLTLPFAALANTQAPGYRFVTGTGNRQTMGVIGFGTNIASIQLYDGSYPGVDGAFFSISGTYEMQ